MVSSVEDHSSRVGQGWASTVADGDCWDVSDANESLLTREWAKMGLYTVGFYSCRPKQAFPIACHSHDISRKDCGLFVSFQQ